MVSPAANKNWKQFSDPEAERIRDHTNVDDFVSRAQAHDGAVSFYTKARSLMTSGGFNLRSWTSNNPAVRTIRTRENLLNNDQNQRFLQAVEYYR